MAISASDNALHLWRSKTIDAFAHAEASVDLLLRKSNTSTKTDMFSAKIDALRKAMPSSAIAEERKIKIDQVLVELMALLPLRNDIVHAPMIIERAGEGSFATFANPNFQCNYSIYKRVLPAPRFQALATKVAQVAKSLEVS